MSSRTEIPSGRYAYIGGIPKPTFGRNTFDSAKARIILRGDKATFHSLFPPGSATSGISSTLFLTTATIDEDLHGHIWADLEWRGFYLEKSMVFSHAVTTRETEWPQTADLAGGTPYTYFVPGSMIGKTTDINPNTDNYWRVRLTDQLSSLSARGYTKASILSPPPPPAIGGSATAPTIGGKVIRPLARPTSFAGLLDPVYNFPSGWVVRNYDFEEVIELSGGDSGQALYLWKADLTYNPAFGP